MPTKFDRRTFVGASLAVSAATTALIAPTHLLSFLASPEASTQVMQILKKYLAVTDSNMAFVETFTKSLAAGAAHSASGPEFQAKLSGTVDQGELELYVVQEFVATTNYATFVSGLAPNLAMVPDMDAVVASAQRIA